MKGSQGACRTKQQPAAKGGERGVSTGRRVREEEEEVDRA